MRMLPYRCLLKIITLRCRNGGFRRVILRLFVIFLTMASIAFFVDFLRSTISSLTVQPGEAYIYNESYYYLRKHDNPLRDWLDSGRCFCERQICGFAKSFAFLKNVVLDPRYRVGRPGGEQLHDVMNQIEKAEYLNLEKGFFQVKCKNQKFRYSFHRKDHLRLWPLLVTDISSDKYAHVNNFTIAVMRYEYANLYHTITDWFNAYLILQTFDKNASETTVLWVDSHPKGGLDDAWYRLFGNVIRAGQLKRKTFFREMAWSITGYYSLLMKHELNKVPYLEQFREFFLTRFHFNFNRTLNCNKIRVLFIWRRDYIAHPRNPAGKIERKVKNEKELESAVRNNFSSVHVEGVQMDQLPIEQQLRHAINTDILIGMHGAGLSFTLLLPQHASLIELYPINKPTKNKHFRKLAEWRRLKYRKWQNQNVGYEYKSGYTYIPPHVLLKLVADVINESCS